MKRLTAVAGLLLIGLAGCRPQVPADAARSGQSGVTISAPSALPSDAWIGKWVGVEGLALDIQPRGAAGRYRLTVWTMDGVGQYAGQADGSTIGFIRDGKPQRIRSATGEETGLKWLAGKKDCLMIQPGEGFCRD